MAERKRGVKSEIMRQVEVLEKLPKQVGSPTSTRRSLSMVLVSSAS